MQTDKGELFISGVENDSTHPAEPNSLYREFEWIILLLYFVLTKMLISSENVSYCEVFFNDDLGVG